MGSRDVEYRSQVYRRGYAAKALDAVAVTYALSEGQGNAVSPCPRCLASERPPVGPSETVYV